MKVMIVGGSPGKKKSSVIDKIAERFWLNEVCKVVNGEDLPDVAGHDLILWMPDISNDEDKQYPTKDKGAVLICSKVMREGYTIMDAMARIYKMHGNAVIAIYKKTGRNFRFELVDALGHMWYNGYDITGLCLAIGRLTNWTKDSVRKSIPKYDGEEFPNLDGFQHLADFMDLNRDIALKSAAQCGNRFFGNFSTRCTKLFPSLRSDNEMIIMSPRNVDKRTLTETDMVPIVNGKYFGDRKPSVDAPVQLALYEGAEHVNYMIHGHAYVRGMPSVRMTKDYYPCGDMREAAEVIELLNQGIMAINLKNHGFLLATESLATMKFFRDTLSFEKTF